MRRNGVRGGFFRVILFLMRNHAIEAALTLVALFCAPGAAAQSDERPEGPRFALVVGVDRYDALSCLRGAAADSFAFAAYLRDAGFDQVRQVNEYAAGGRVDRSTFLKTLDEVAGAAQESNARGERVGEFVLFFSGHGSRRGDESALRFADADPEGEGGTVLLEADVLPRIRSIGARSTLVFLDACREGEGAELPLWDSAAIPPARRPAMPGSSFFILYAAAPGGISYEKLDGSGGLFTETLLRALREGGASLASLVDYVARNLPARSLAERGVAQVPSVGGDFNPSMLFSAAGRGSGRTGGSGELVVSTVPSGAEIAIGGRVRGTSPLVVGDAPAGSVRVRARKDGLSAEADVEVEANASVVVALTLREPEGRILVASEHRVLEYSVDGGEYRSVSGDALIRAQAGTRTLRITAEGGYFWEGRAEVVPDRTIVIAPEFEEAGTLRIVLQRPALIHVRGSDGTPNGEREFVFVESEDVRSFPAGSYEAALRDRRYLPWSGTFNLGRGMEILLEPRLNLSPYGEMIFEFERLSALLPHERLLRKRLNVTGLASVGLSIALAAFGVLSYRDYVQASRAYRAASAGADFPALRSEVSSAYARMAASTVSSGLLALAGTATLILGPRPSRTEERLRALEVEIGQ